jgi:biotin transport system substrate-specific component
MTSTHAPLALALTGSTDDAGLLRKLLLVVAGSLLLAASARIQVPFWPVPMTMQPYVVLVLGMALGRTLGPAAVALYLVEGALGLPVFAGTPEKGIGLAYMAGPTGGYLAGFLAAALITGELSARGLDRRPLTALLTATAGMVAIYTLGLAWLATLVGSLERAFALGAAPFLAGDVLKILLATATLPLAWRLLGRGAHAR